MNLVSLLVLPAVISLEDKGIRFVIAGIALAVLIAAIAFSKRESTGMDEPAHAVEAPPAGATS
jgi:hypothetical protein